MKKTALAIAAATMMIGVTAHGKDYRAEIMDNVVKPCFLTIATVQPEIEGVSREQMAMMAMAIASDGIEQIVLGINVLLKHDPRLELREALYEIALESCVIDGTS